MSKNNDLQVNAESFNGSSAFAALGMFFAGLLSLFGLGRRREDSLAVA